MITLFWIFNVLIGDISALSCCAVLEEGDGGDNDLSCECDLYCDCDMGDCDRYSSALLVYIDILLVECGLNVSNIFLLVIDDCDTCTGINMGADGDIGGGDMLVLELSCESEFIFIFIFILELELEFIGDCGLDICLDADSCDGIDCDDCGGDSDRCDSCRNGCEPTGTNLAWLLILLYDSRCCLLLVMVLLDIGIYGDGDGGEDDLLLLLLLFIWILLLVLLLVLCMDTC